MKIYVATSWKNAERAEALIGALRYIGYDVYNFMENSFNWATLETDDWFNDSRVHAHYLKDLEALKTCDVLIAIFPCGNSTHIEIGFVAGRGKPIIALSDAPLKRDLLYKSFEKVFMREADLIDYMSVWRVI